MFLSVIMAVYCVWYDNHNIESCREMCNGLSLHFDITLHAPVYPDVQLLSTFDRILMVAIQLLDYKLWRMVGWWVEEKRRLYQGRQHRSCSMASSFT